MELRTEAYDDIVRSITKKDTIDVYAALKAHCFGNSNARHLKTKDGRTGLVELSGLGYYNSSTNRKIRKIIQGLSDLGVGIVSDKNGYWLTLDPTEIISQANRYRSRAKSCIQTAEALELSAKENSDHNHQQSLF